MNFFGVSGSAKYRPGTINISNGEIHPLLNAVTYGLPEDLKTAKAKQINDYLTSLQSIGVIKGGLENIFQTDSLLYFPVFNDAVYNQVPFLSPSKVRDANLETPSNTRDSIHPVLSFVNQEGIQHTDKKLIINSPSTLSNATIELLPLGFNKESILDNSEYFIAFYLSSTDVKSTYISIKIGGTTIFEISPRLSKNSNEFENSYVVLRPDISIDSSALTLPDLQLAKNTNNNPENSRIFNQGAGLYLLSYNFHAVPGNGLPGSYDNKAAPTFGFYFLPTKDGNLTKPLFQLKHTREGKPVGANYTSISDFHLENYPNKSKKVGSLFVEKDGLTTSRNKQVGFNTLGIGSRLYRYTSLTDYENLLQKLNDLKPQTSKVKLFESLVNLSLFEFTFQNKSFRDSNTVLGNFHRQNKDYPKVIGKEEIKNFYSGKNKYNILYDIKKRLHFLFDNTPISISSKPYIFNSGSLVHTFKEEDVIVLLKNLYGPTVVGDNMGAIGNLKDTGAFNKTGNNSYVPNNNRFVSELRTYDIENIEYRPIRVSFFSDGKNYSKNSYKFMGVGTGLNTATQIETFMRSTLTLLDNL